MLLCGDCVRHSLTLSSEYKALVEPGKSDCGAKTSFAHQGRDVRDGLPGARLRDHQQGLALREARDAELLHLWPVAVPRSGSVFPADNLH